MTRPAWAGPWPLAVLGIAIAACCPRRLPERFVPAEVAHVAKARGVDPALPERITADDVVRAAIQSWHRLRGISAAARLDAFTRDGRAKVRVMILAVRPAALRFETLSPFEQPISTLATSGTRFTLYDFAKKRFYRGPASPQNVARLLPIALRPEEIAEILLGGAPILTGGAGGSGAQTGAGIAHVIPVTGEQRQRQRQRQRHSGPRREDGKTALRFDRCNGVYRVEMQHGGLTQRLTVNARTLRPEESEVRDTSGLLYRLTFGGEIRAGAVLLPSRLRFEAPRDKVDLQLDYLDADADPKPETDSFELKPPKGIGIIEVP